jgi:ubiquinone biosynthesis protein
MPSGWTDIKKYSDLTVLLIKFGTMMAGRRDMADPLKPNGEPADPHLGEQANRLTDELEQLGPSYIKLGQFLSTRADDILPPPVSDSLSRLQDRVAPFSYPRSWGIPVLPLFFS